MQTHQQKFAPTLALKWYPQDLIGRAKLFDISAASQYQGGKYIFSPQAARTFPVWPAKRRVLQRAVCRLAARIDNNNNTSFKYLEPNFLVISKVSELESPRVT